jgi:hypothetical protein
MSSYANNANLVPKYSLVGISSVILVVGPLVYVTGVAYWICIFL